MENAMTRAGCTSLLLISLLGTTLVAKAEEIAATPAKLGKVAFANSCAPAAQKSFERGVALLHSFWFAEGDKAFSEALDRDPGCAIATWGIATILVGNTFTVGPSPADAQRAHAAIDRGRAIGAKTKRERDYIEAIAAYYDHFAERSNGARMRSLSDAFEALAARYPDDDETQIFDALYLTASQSLADKSYTRALKAASILEPQFAKHEDHPGVAHYLIHSYDYSALAVKGLPAAMCYASIAPDAYHALHMPSHIFTRVGAWKESIDTNARSIVEAKAENVINSVLHAMDYTVYAELQLGRDASADAIVQESFSWFKSDFVSVYARAAIPARYPMERGQWTAAAALPDPADSKYPYTGAMTLFARGIGAARSGNPAAAEKDTARLDVIVAALKTAKNDYWATEVEEQRLSVAAWIAFAQDRREEALRLMRSAADMEDASEKDPVSPGRILPARELLGDMLLESGRPEEALAAYESSLVNDPKRLRSYNGAAQAALAAGNAVKARDYFSQAVEMTDPDSTRPELIRAREYLAAK
jgi:tetratricopeptide (TPR) repeat protein